MNYSVNVESFSLNFPPGFTPPPLLIEFATWLSEQPWGSLGSFSIASERFSDYWIENGADLHPEFAFFMSDPTGGQIGFLIYDDIEMKAPPIVLLGSEGETKIIGDTLEVFLRRLAEGETEVEDLDTIEEGPDHREKLSQWLDSRGIFPSITSEVDHPDLTQRLEAWGQQQRELSNNDERHIKLTESLRKYRKPKAKEWDTTNFDVLIVGTHFQMWHRSFGPQLLPADQVADLEPLFRSLRESRARAVPERGLWFTAWVTVGATGSATLSCNFMEEPKILDEKPSIPAEEYQRDLQAFPRSKQWMPDWLVEKMGSAE